MLHIEGRDYRAEPVDGDGNCLFRSIAKALFTNVSVHLCTRLAIVEHIVNQWEDFGCYTVSRNGDAYPTADAYRREMLVAGTFGGTAEILAIPAVYGVNVQVWSLNSSGCPFLRISHPQPAVHGQTILLKFWGAAHELDIVSTLYQMLSAKKGSSGLYICWLNLVAN